MPNAKIEAPPSPATAARRKTREDVALARTNAAKATSVPALKVEVERLADVLDTVLDLLEERPS